MTPPRVRKWLLHIVCAVLLLPGWGDLLENIEHLSLDGHLAHSAPHEEAQLIQHQASVDTEHGCTPLSHTCSCHRAIPAILGAADPVPQRRLLAARELLPERDDRPVSRANAPPVPPPVA